MERVSIAKLILVGICMLLVTSTFGQNVSPVLSFPSFDSLWHQVLRDNPSEKIYQLNIRKASLDQKTSQSFYYPNVGAGVTAQDNLYLPVTPVPGELINRPGTTYDVRFGKQFNYGAGLSATQTVFNWTSVLASKIATNNVLLNQAQEGSYLQSLRENTARNYYALLIARASLQVALRDQQLADSLVTVAGWRLDQGLTDATALNQAKINRGDVQINLAQSQQLYDQALANLRMLLGKRSGDGIAFTDTLDIKESESEQPFILGPDKNLDVYQLQLSTATLTKRQKQSAYYPSVSLDGYYGYQQFQDQLTPSFTHGAWSNYSYIGLNLNVPLFTGFYNSGNVRSATVSEKIAALQYDNAQLQSAVGDDLLHKQYLNDLAMTRAARGNFLLYGDNEALARQKYGEGLLALDLYLKVFEDYLTSENAYLNNLSNLYTTRATILGRNP
jgi:outer membrane protein